MSEIIRQTKKRLRLATKHSSLNTGVKRGFTFIELLLYMGLVAVFMTAVTYFAWDASLGNVKARVYQEVQENFRFASQRLQVDIRNAGGIDAASSSFGVNLAANPGTKLRLLGSAPYPTEFRVDQGALQIKRGASDWVALTSSSVEVTNLTFTNLTDTGSENVHFSLTVRYRNPSGRSEWEKEETVETSVQVR
jgi:Tfp pilus assembly protein PilW